MVRPKPCVLFAQSFLHPRLAEYVDEVRFTEPVIICACEFLELHASSVCPTLSLSGVSFPQSFALEIFVRSGGEARFKRLCPAFLYSPSTSSVLEVQAAVTDHLIIRGSYRALSLVLYGNSAKDLGHFNADHDIDSTLSNLILPPEAVFKSEDLPEPLQHEGGNMNRVFSPLKNLQLVYRDPEQSVAIYQLLSLAVDITKTISDHVAVGRVFDVLLSAASTVLSEHGIESGFPQWPPLTKTPAQSQRKVKNALKQARDQIQEINVELQNKGILEKESSDLVMESTIMEVICNWIQKSFQLSPRIASDMSVEEHLMVGLAAVQLLCTDAHWCFQFVAAGGVQLLMNVLQYSSAESSATALLVLGAIKCACQHAFACEALLGWWHVNAAPTEDKTCLSIGYCAILKLLLQAKRQNVAQLASQVLHHLQAYELVSEFQCEVDYVLETFPTILTDAKGRPVFNETMKKINAALKQLGALLNAKDFPQDWSPAQMAHWLILDGDDDALTLPPNAIFSWITASKYSFAFKDLNAHILLVLQERRFIPSLAALLSAPWMRCALGECTDSFLEFVGNMEALILALISSRSGLLFLASDQEAAAGLVSGLVGIEELHGSEFVNLRHACSLTSAGFLCKTEDIGRMLQTSLTVVGAVDRLLATSRRSESFLWILWELSVFSRSENGRQALSAIAYFPEVFVVLVEALQPGSQYLTPDTKEGRALKRAILHSAAEIMQVILMDPIAGSLAAWIPHALSLQKALQYWSPTTIDIAVGSHALGSGSKDALCARLLDWVDAAVVFHKKGPIGLLRYAAALVAGSVLPIAGGLPASDSVEPDNTMAESAGSTELPTVDTLLGRGIMLGVSGTVLPDTSVIQLTVSMRLMSSISCHPGMAASLYGEGAMAILYILLEYGACFLQTATSDYDYIVEEDGEGDGISEMILEQGRELSLLNLLLPCLLLLLNLLRRLQLTGEEYRNTRLVEILLQLHSGVCARLASRVTVRPQAGVMLVLASVSHVLASVLACWPIFGWTPTFFPKLLGVNTFNLVQTSNLLPFEPKEAVSILCLLGDMLPEESPQLCTNGMLATDISRCLAVRTMLGVKSMKVVGWHYQHPNAQKLIQAVGLHLDHISSMVIHLFCTTSTILQGLIIKLTIRVSCQNEDYAAALLRPILVSLQENTAAGTSSISEQDVFKVKRLLELLRELVKHPTTKRILLRVGIVQFLLQAIDVKNNPSNKEGNSSAADESSTFLCWSQLVLQTLVTICDPDIAMIRNSPLNKRLVEDCPSFVEYCSIVESLHNFCVSVPLGEELDIATESMGKIASHQLGRAAFAYIALSSRTSTSLSFSLQKDSVELDAMDSDTQDTGCYAPEGNCLSFVPLCKRLAMALTENTDLQVIVGIIEHFSLAAIRLSAAGRSSCGLGALQMLFEMDKMETKEILNSIMNLLEKAEQVLEGNSKNLVKISCQKAHKAVTIMLRLLENIPAIMFLEKKVKLVVDGLSLSQPSKGEKPSIERALPQWKFLPGLFCEAKGVDIQLTAESLEEMDADVEDTLKEKFTWECAAVSPDKPSMTSAAAKRKSSGNADGGSKKHRADGGASGPAAEVVSNVNGSLTGRGTGLVSSTSNASRRDTFRQRKPNTSRPPSMHVDDYVARERGSETNTAVSGGMNQRGASGGGRPPSIHVDEFMARQRERQLVVGAPASVDTQAQSAPPPQSQLQHVKAESPSGSGRVFRPMMTEDDELQDVEIEIDGVPDTDDLLSLSVADVVVEPAGDESTVLLENTEKLGTKIELTIVDAKSKDPGLLPTSELREPDDAENLNHPVNNSRQQINCVEHAPVQGERIDESLLRNTLPDSLPSASQNLKIQAPLGMEKTSLVMPLMNQETMKTSFGSYMQTIGEHRPSTVQDAASMTAALHQAHSQFSVAPPLPPPPPIPAGVIPEKYETSTGIDQHPFSAANMPVMSFDKSAKDNVIAFAGNSRMVPHLTDYHRGISGSSSNAAVTTPPPPLPPPPPPPPPLPGPWQPVEPVLRRMDPAHGAPLNPSFSALAPGHPSGLLSIGAGTPVLHGPLPPWSSISVIADEAGSTGTGRPPPPLPPTPPPFSSTQASVLQVHSLTPNIIPHSPSLYPHNIGRLPSESRSVYTVPSGMDVPAIDKRFTMFPPSLLGQNSLPQSPNVPSFLPPLPPGRPNTSQSLPVSGSPTQQQQAFNQSQQILQPSPPPQQPEPVPTAIAQLQQTQFQQQMHQAPVQQQAQQSQQQESGKLIQQILASPDAIQDLLKDQNKLQKLLEQHPKLISLLQEKMGQG